MNIAENKQVIVQGAMDIYYGVKKMINYVFDSMTYLWFQ